MYRGISDFKKGYRPRTNVVKDEKGDLFADCYSILAWWRNYFSLLLNVHGVNDIKHTVIRIAEPLVSEPIAFEVELAIEKIKSHKSPGIDKIRAELIKEGCRINRHEIHTLIFSIWDKEELPEEWKELIIFSFYKKGNKASCSNYSGISLSPTTNKILSNILLSRLNPYAEEFTVDHQGGFRLNRSTTDHLFCIRQILEKNWEQNEEMHQLFIDIKKAFDSVK